MSQRRRDLAFIAASPPSLFQQHGRTDRWSWWVFDVGIGAILAIPVVCLVLFGPERLPELARQAGRLLGHFQLLVHGALDRLQEESDLKDLNLPDLRVGSARCGRRPARPPRPHGRRGQTAELQRGRGRLRTALEGQREGVRSTAAAHCMDQADRSGGDTEAPMRTRPATTPRATGTFSSRSRHGSGIAAALVGKGLDGLVIQGGSGSCGSVQISWAEQRQNRARADVDDACPLVGAVALRLADLAEARQTPAGCPRQASPRRQPPC